MIEKEWHDKYRARMKEMLICDDKFAEETLQAGMGDYDYESDPVDAADEELSYWIDQQT